jgi:fido (protein-threonine AMPylation protein)
MLMSAPLLPEHSALLDVMGQLHAEGHQDLKAPQIAQRAGLQDWQARRMLAFLAADGHVVSAGHTRGRVYRLPPSNRIAQPLADHAPVLSNTLAWSPEAVKLATYLALPVSQRELVTYQRGFVENYRPNHDFLLGEQVASTLYDEGKIRGQFPAGTYLRKVLGQLLVDLAWSSSNLEGNRISYLDTQKLFELEADADGLPAFPPGADAEHRILLINHKHAINFLAEQVPDSGLSMFTVRNLHALLMADLVSDIAQLGAVRRHIVSIGGSTYTPLSMPQVLEEMLVLVLDKAAQIKNPVEAGFFLWVNIAYLQPFIDGNKRTSRLAANIPLMLYNCSPLSFMDVNVQDYNRAMQGVYECNDVSIASDLFTWLYRRSIARYGTVTQAMGSYDPDVLALRPYVTAALIALVRENRTQDEAIQLAQPPEQLLGKFRSILAKEVAGLSPFNSQRHGITPAEVNAWKRTDR